MKKFLSFIAMVSLCAISVFAASAGKGPVKINDENYSEYLSDAHPTVIEFSATWCGPCKAFAPIYHEVAGEMSDQFNFYMVDVDQSPKLARLLSVTAVPTVVIINPENEKIDVIQGLVDKAEFTKRLKAIL